ncbi:Monocarboxylate transporter 5 [Aphelenchoides besseyi]|nr:Monocarboxylate transporter 5 [Aphelenchoides besseyi]KAI6201534.1 Monocarboxylate transporter 5 [Aphelenchoides besseyi]
MNHCEIQITHITQSFHFFKSSTQGVLSNEMSSSIDRPDDLHTVPTVLVDEGTPSSTTPQPVKQAHEIETPTSDQLPDKNELSATTPTTMAPNGVVQQYFNEDDDAYTDYAEQNVMDDDEYADDESSSGSMNEMLNNIRPDAIIDQLPAPPDGGYGWIIVAGAFFNNMIVDGIANSFGPFMPAYEKEFGESKALTSFIGALLIGCCLLFGPFAGGLLNRYNARVVVIAGALLASLAFFASTFSPNIVFHLFFYGFLGGGGFSLIYLPGIVVVSQYFESKRALATGIAVAGSGFGTFLLPVVCKSFIEQYSWQVSLYVNIVGILLCAACGGLFVPLEVEPIDSSSKPTLKERVQELLKKKFSRTRKQTEGSRAPSVISQTEINANNVGRTISSRPDSQLLNDISRDDGQPLLPHDNETNTTDVNADTADTIASPSTPRRALSPIKEVVPVLNITTSIEHQRPEFTTGSRVNLANQLSRISVRSYAQSLSRLSQINANNMAESMGSVAVSSIDPKEFTRPFSRKDIFLQGSIRNLKEFENEGNDYRNYRESQISIPKAVLAQSLQSVVASRNTSQLDIADMSTRLGGSRYSRIGGLENDDVISLSTTTYCLWIPYPIRNSIQEMIDINLLRDPVMVLMCLCNVVAMLGFYVPLVFIIDLAVTRGSTVASGTVLLSIIGATNTFGRIFFGWMADRRWLSALTISNVSLLTCGFLTVMCFTFVSYPLLCLYAGLFGFAISAFISLTSIVLSDLLGVERLTNSFGLLIVSRGLASLIGTPLAGCVYDMTRSYDATFICAGVMFILSGLIGLMVAVFHHRARSQLKNEGDYNMARDADAISGKLSVLTERSEEEYQRTIQSVYAQQELIRELHKCRQNDGKVSVVNEESNNVADNPNDSTDQPIRTIDLNVIRTAQ